MCFLGTQARSLENSHRGWSLLIVRTVGHNQQQATTSIKQTLDTQRTSSILKLKARVISLAKATLVHVRDVYTQRIR